MAFQNAQTKRLRTRPRLRRNTQGVTAVEFALVVPVLLTLLFACLEFGMIGYTYIATNSAMHETARQLATNQITPEQAQASIQARLPNWVKKGVTAEIKQSSPYDASVNTFTIAVNYPAMAATPSHFLAFAYRERMINQSMVMRQEPLI